jgi:Flp pilus assembly protein TadG
MSRLPNQVFTIVVFALMLFFIFDFSQRILVNIRLEQTAKQLERQVAQAQATRDALAAKRTRVSSPEYVESFVRTQWHWVRDGETLVLTQITPAAAPPVSPVPAPTPMPEIPWWQNLFEFLFGP